MPSWTDENGFNWFNKLECKRCLKVFEAKDGEVPPHKCLNGDIVASKGYYDEFTSIHHVPYIVKRNTSAKR